MNDIPIYVRYNVGEDRLDVMTKPPLFEPLRHYDVLMHPLTGAPVGYTDAPHIGVGPRWWRALVWRACRPDGVREGAWWRMEAGAWIAYWEERREA